jgi:hypothetical protein
MTDAINWHPNGTPGPWTADECPWADGNFTFLEVQPFEVMVKATDARAIAEVPAMVMALRAIANVEPRTHVQDDWFFEARAILARIDGGAA